MPPKSRPAVAAIAASMVNGRRYSSVYDYSGSGYVDVEAVVKNGEVQAYDHGRMADISGSLPSSVYDYGDSSFYEFKLKSADTIDGYHYGTSSFFEAKVRGRAVDLYDYEVGSYFQYEVR